MRKYKKIIIIGFGILIVLAIAASFARKANNNLTLPVPTPNIPKTFEGSFEIELDVASFDLPREATIDNKKTEKISSEEASQIANNLSITGEPIAADDIEDGKVEIYRSEKEALIAYLDRGRLTYTLNNFSESINKKLTDEEIISIAKNFLIQNAFVKDDNIKVANIFYLEKGGPEGFFEGKRENAAIFQVNFSPSSLGHPLISLDPSRAPLRVQILTDGEVFSANTERIIATKGVTAYRLKNLDEIKTSLEGAILVSLEKGNLHLPDLAEKDVRKVVIKKIELAYLNERSDLLKPIYLLTGEAEVKGFTEKIEAVLYLPAIKN